MREELTKDPASNITGTASSFSPPRAIHIRTLTLRKWSVMSMAQAVAIVLILVFLILNVISLAYINGKIKQDWFLGSLAFCTLAVLGLFAVLASLAA